MPQALYYIMKPYNIYSVLPKTCYSANYRGTFLQILDYGAELNLLNVIQGMWEGILISKEAWKKLVWQNVWIKDSAEWSEVDAENPYLDLVRLISPCICCMVVHIR